MECSEEVLTIVSMLSANNYVFVRPKKRQREADGRKLAFNDYKVGE
jgi:ATP-dependent RNA helicase DHX8/PRP22